MFITAKQACANNAPALPYTRLRKTNAGNTDREGVSRITERVKNFIIAAEDKSITPRQLKNEGLPLNTKPIRKLVHEKYAPQTQTMHAC